ncbi:MAG: cation-transporting P-type ATPase, partial [Candidatus Poribacteria bacterium]|nr:cation-transporting P-type ATPase [Candidatus Poribacteria bacterium]
MLDWYTQNIPYLLREFKTDLERGLSREEATTHYQKYGSNEIRQPRETSLLTIFLKQLSSLTAILLFVICILLYLQHAIREGLVLVSIFCFHVLWRFIQAAKTRHQLQSIQQHLDVSVSVIRDAGVIKLPPMALVPGDLLVLTAGDYIAADARLIDADALLVDETPLFGTTTFAQKTDEDISDPGLPPEKQRNMVFAGTYVLEGEARAIVVGTGQQLEINQPNRRVP